MMQAAVLGFLILSALASRGLAVFSTCDCHCSSEQMNVCDAVSGLLASVTAVEDTMKNYDLEFPRFKDFLDRKEIEIAEVVDAAMKRHAAVAPEPPIHNVLIDETEKREMIQKIEEAKKLSLDVKNELLSKIKELEKENKEQKQRFSAYIEEDRRRTSHMERELRSVEDTVQSLQKDLENCARSSSLSALDGALRDHERSAAEEHQSIRSEVSSHDVQLREWCAPRKDLVQMNDTLEILAWAVQNSKRERSMKLEDEATPSNDTEVTEAELVAYSPKEREAESVCTDSPLFVKCEGIIKANNCANTYYAKYCCDSCTKAGQLPPK